MAFAKNTGKQAEISEQMYAVWNVRGINDKYYEL
jgi:hypothetical protein